MYFFRCFLKISAEDDVIVCFVALFAENFVALFPDFCAFRAEFSKNTVQTNQSQTLSYLHSRLTCDQGTRPRGGTPQEDELLRYISYFMHTFFKFESELHESC